MAKVSIETIRLNKFISSTGYCSRRKADELILEGVVKVNNRVVKELGIQVSSKDQITVNNVPIKPQNEFSYFIMNKPKDYITTMKDEKNRKTVYDILKTFTELTLKPVGRLDRNTTGVLLFTDDGEFIHNLTHPSSQVTKIYEVTVDKRVTPNQLKQIQEGAQLEDGFFKPDEIRLLEEENQFVVQIHSGKNRIIRRYFNHFNLDVVILDRIYFAGITKNKLPRGQCRKITAAEVKVIKSLNYSKVNDK